VVPIAIDLTAVNGATSKVKLINRTMEPITYDMLLNF
jgi:hypothetical protein